MARRKLTVDRHEEIKRRLADGRSLREIATALGCSRRLVRQIRDGERLRLFGAGIVSSNGESEYALDSPEPLRIGFDLKRTMLTDYRIDSFQRNYFVIDSFEDLVRRTSVDFAGIYKELEGIAPIAVGTRLPTDILFAPNPKP